MFIEQFFAILKWAWLSACRSTNGSGASKDVMDSLRANVDQHKASMKWARAIVVENKCVALPLTR